ncbi:MAG: hypothetical protein HY681_02740 [Chloroflexi bacterium]|nr:hypothetical protein [Chloroflexota bacterium]
MSWQAEFEKKLVTPENAAKLVQPGWRVAFALGGAEPKAFGDALAARRREIKDISVFVPVPRRDFGWYDSANDEGSSITVGYLLPQWRERLGARVDYRITTLDYRFKAEHERPEDHAPPDVYICEVSAPDDHGFCSFGAARWDKKERLRAARVGIAQINSKLIRTFGDNFVHISEVSHFLEDQPREARDPQPPAIPEEVRKMAEFIKPLIRDGDTVQIGAGSATEPLASCGVFNGRNDLGLHTEFVAYGIVDLVRQGVFTGARKTLHKGRMVATATGGTLRDLEFVHENPLFELYGHHYTHDIRTIAAHDNMVAIDNCLAVDLSGQITAESLGPRIMAGPGGQPAFAIGALLSRGGRFISVLPSTATTAGGKVSRIVPRLPEGTVITIPRTVADYVVTEYGVAKLLGKTLRSRAEALIEIAHPDFRPELRNEGRKMFWGA